jgi:phosphatidylserine decarboxylase
VAKIHNFHKFSNLHDLENSLKSKDNQDVMQALEPYKNDNIGKLLNKIIAKFQKHYETPKESFEKKKYNTFMDYFTRKLSEDTKKELENQAQNCSMVLPAECDIESIGEISNTDSILRLKKPGAEVQRDLQSKGIDVSDMSFINMKLLKAYYHRIHCPVSGKIDKLLPIGKDDPMFGDNSLWIVDIDAEEHGHVILLLVGELSIQDFKFFKKEGDEVKIFDELGRFDWGSQVVMLFEADKFPGGLLIDEGQTYFVGAPAYFKKADSQFGATPDALGGGTVTVDPNGQPGVSNRDTGSTLDRPMGTIII